MGEVPVQEQIARHLNQQNQRAIVKDGCAKVEPCDGSDPTLVKRFLRELELIPLQIRFEVFEHTARDSLLREGLYWGRQQAGQRQWPALKEHLIKAFVSQDAEGALRKELFAISRQPLETVVSYNRRFRDLMNEAYPLQVDEHGQEIPRNPDQMEILIKTYATGLRDRTLARKIITPDWPETIQQAMERTALNEKAGDNLVRLGYRDTAEPMEVDAISHNMAGKSKPNYTQTEKDLHALKSQYGKLERKLDELIRKPAGAATAFHHARQNSDRDPRKCFFCGLPGHIQRQCRKFKTWQNQQKQTEGRPANMAEVQQSQ
jgi:hypothetical protein